MPLSGNRGEWSEIYIFLKLLDDGKVYAADSNMEKINSVYLNILKILREENAGSLYEYKTGSPIKIDLNGVEVGPNIDHSDLQAAKNELWRKFQTTPNGNISSATVETFLNSIHITKLKSPPIATSAFFGGTEDIVLQVSDYRTSIISNIGFSCKSEFKHKSTLFNASKDNTNFCFELTGNMNDTVMNQVNSLFTPKHKKDGTVKYNIAVADRIKELKNAGVMINFAKQIEENAERNIVLSGGTEMPSVVAFILKNYYWEHNGETAHSSFSEAIQYVVDQNPAGYAFSDIESIYRSKIGKLLYDMFTGMRLAKPWDGRSNVSGGYIVVKDDGDVLAYHTTLADEFKDFLVEKLGLETPSSSRHNAMQIYKEDDRYYINFNLQVRFKG